MCDQRDETVMHINSECSKMAQTEYNKSHDKVVTMVRWKLCSQYNFEAAKQCYELRAEGGDGKPEHKDLVGFQYQNRPCYKSQSL